MHGFIFAFSIFIFHPYTIKSVSINFLTSSNCSKGSSISAAEFLNKATLLCESCSQSIQFQRQSDDGSSCICQPGYRYTKNFGGSQVTCVACPNLNTVTSDGLFCFSCSTAFISSSSTCQACPSDSISVFHDQTGASLASSTCKKCTGTSTSSGNTCEQCSTTINMLRSSGLPDTDCRCPNTPVDNICFPGITPAQTNIAGLTPVSVSRAIPPQNNQLFLVNQANSLDASQRVTSSFLVNNAMSTIAFCSADYLNITACEVLANMCVLQLYDLRNTAIRSYSACEEYIVISNARPTKRDGFTNWAANLPWLYYDPEVASTTLSDVSISTIFASNYEIPLLLASYTLNGSFIGYQNAVQTGALQLCKDSATRMQAGFKFGTAYSQTCEINVDDLFDERKYPLTFYDPYIFFYDKNKQGSPVLTPVPVRNLAIIGSGSSFVNILSTSDESTINSSLALGNFESAAQTFTNAQANWKLTRRFFLVDNIAARTDSGVNLPNQQSPNRKIASFVRYAKSVKISITSMDPTVNPGRIYPPLITIDYANIIASDSYGLGKTIKASFAVEYLFPTTTASNFDFNLRISLGVLSAIASCYGMLRTWLWSRRAGVLRLDTMLIVKLVLFTMSAIANMFFLVIFGLSFYHLIFYKNQDVFVLTMPPSDNYVLVYIAAAFILKAFDLTHLLAIQSTVDIFFVDWEHPSASSAISSQGDKSGKIIGVENLLMTTARKTNQDIEKHLGHLEELNKPMSRQTVINDTGVSFWRTIFVANEWNEIQTHRKTVTILTLLSVLFFMRVVGFENLATWDPKVRYIIDTNIEYKPKDNAAFRLALISSIFILTALFQWLFNLLIWEKFFSDKLRNFADLCSVANISVFILAQSNFGFYIHGHSPNGKADYGLGGIVNCLSAENQGVTTSRGINTESDDHTYRMALPKGLRTQLDRIYSPLYSRSGAASAQNLNSIVQTYKAVNRFLIHFISRDDPDGLRYRIVDRKPLEDILDGEFDDTTQEGLFYKDDGNSFGSVLFYDNEFSLFIFEMLLFLLVDLLSYNLVLDVVITWIVHKLVVLLREDLGKRNLASKTLIDQRFLI